MQLHLKVFDHTIRRPEILDHRLARHQFVLLHLPPYNPELKWKQTQYHWRTFTTWAHNALLSKVQRLRKGFGGKSYISYA